MTTPELAAALAAQRAAFRPDAVPPFSGVIGRRRRRDRRRHIALAGGLALVVATGALAAGPVALDRDEPTRDRVARPATAPQPDRQRLQTAFAFLVWSLTVTDIPAMREAGPIGELPRTHGAGLLAQSADATFSLSWVVLTPAMTEAGVIALAGSTGEGVTLEQGVPVAGATQQEGAVRSAAYRFAAEGSLVRILAWSTDGGFVSLTSGRGATTTDAQVTAWAAAARSLLAP
jgi:hypothetical protein